MRKTNYGAVLGALLLAGLPLGGTAVAQTATEAKPKTDNPWVKLCNTDPKKKKEICLTSREIRAKTGQPLSSVLVIEPQGETRKILRILVPPGMQIQPGLAVQVDKGKQRNAKFAICFPNTCFGEVAIDANFVKTLRAGNNLVVTVINHQGKQVPYRFSLVGFTAANESKGLDPVAFRKSQEEAQRKFQEQAQKRSEEIRKRLIDAQRKAAEKGSE